jgi:hypothetical protein
MRAELLKEADRLWRRLSWNPDAGRRLRRLARRRPWERPPAREAAPACGLKGMLGGREAILFYHLARDVFSGRGTVVDAGSFLGKSASLFATGLLGNPVAPPAARTIHCFDDFVVHESGTVGFMVKEFGRQVAVGDSTRDLFDRQVGPVRDMLAVHAGDFMEARWTGGPIELLLVDIAKSPRLWARLLTEMFPALIPGVSIVIHQDYHHTIAPYLHIVMEYLSPYVELVIPKVDDSAVFLVQKVTPPQFLYQRS